ncbi:GNAT family N-acetyltransferase [Clostridium polynesiense]|uniref:GNAT family N-acetyltransferase n=1 Tax=Clostridium polynesiense TaxID=1325933 RepID=UPI00058CECB3|nr:GNAT family N-acetyltransferase [Clostridium polynesiense]
MENFTFAKSTKEEIDEIENELVEFNNSKVPFTQKESFISMSRTMKDEKGNIVAGLSAVLYCWNCLYIDMLVVKKEFRGKGHGAQLLKEVEKQAKEQGCYLIHLDTFDFQAKDFYIKQGYEIFGVLEDCPKEHKRYFLKKLI